MRLKAWLTGLVVMGLGLLVAWPWILGRKPLAGHTRELQVYAVKYGVYMFALLAVFFATALISVLILRRTREEFRERAVANVKNLIESTLEDHRKKNDAEA